MLLSARKIYTLGTLATSPQPLKKKPRTKRKESLLTPDSHQLLIDRFKDSWLVWTTLLKNLLDLQNALRLRD